MSWLCSTCRHWCHNTEWPLYLTIQRDGLHALYYNTQVSYNNITIFSPCCMPNIWVTIAASLLNTYIHHRSRRSCWCWHIRGCPATRRNFLGTWSCRLATGRWFPRTVCPDPRNHPKISNCSRVGTRHTRTTATGHSTDHECHLQSQHKTVR